MRKVLMVSPHFPPDATAAAHRVRLLAPRLPDCGWEPTVVTVDPRDYEGRLDPGLAELVPSDLRVVRCRALSSRWTRRVGIGDLGLRAFVGLGTTCARLLRRERFDALFVTIYPTYPALLGPMLKRRFGVPFVLDYQDPWVGGWGRTVGAGPGGRVDLKSRLARALAVRLEPIAVRAADAITAVSAATYERVVARYPGLSRIPCAAVPVGAEVADFAALRERPRPNPHFEPQRDRVHICYVGTVLPLGFETLRAVLAAVGLLRVRRPDLYARIRLHFVGSSNQTASDVTPCVLPLARELGVADVVTEHPLRIDYLDALTVLSQADAILLMGSTEPHYTASKLYPALLARRPLLAVFHRDSSVIDLLSRAASSPSARVVTYDDTVRPQARIEAIYAELREIVERPIYEADAIDQRVIKECSAEALAGRLAEILARVSERG